MTSSVCQRAFYGFSSTYWWHCGSLCHSAQIRLNYLSSLWHFLKPVGKPSASSNLSCMKLASLQEWYSTTLTVFLSHRRPAPCCWEWCSVLRTCILARAHQFTANEQEQCLCRASAINLPLRRAAGFFICYTQSYLLIWSPAFRSREDRPSRAMESLSSSTS